MMCVVMVLWCDDALCCIPCHRESGGYVGLRNAAATCYMNSVLQQLYMQPDIRDGVLAAKPVTDNEQPISFFYTFQVLARSRAVGRTCQ